MCYSGVSWTRNPRILKSSFYTFPYFEKVPNNVPDAVSVTGPCVILKML